jgi:hypothetical protein
MRKMRKMRDEKWKEWWWMLSSLNEMRKKILDDDALM